MALYEILKSNVIPRDGGFYSRGSVVPLTDAEVEAAGAAVRPYAVNADATVGPERGERYTASQLKELIDIAVDKALAEARATWDAEKSAKTKKPEA